MIYDISPPLTSRIAVWPGDVPFHTLEPGPGRHPSAFSTTAHVGSHLDAPSHLGPDGNPIDAQPLELYLGPCHVLHPAVGRGDVVTVDCLPEIVHAPRLLLATNTYPDPDRFTRDFAGIDPALLNRLASLGVFLVGIDTPSVDPYSRTDLPAHRACREHNIAILEGLRLAHVPEGLYELIALPLKLIGLDGSPVRAVLRPLASAPS